MIRGLYTAASGMLTKQAQQEALSNNIANLNTAGYKKDKIIMKSFDEMIIENIDGTSKSNSKRSIVGSMEFGVGIDDSKIDFTPGTIEETGRNLDFAIDGDGFFTLEDADGNEKYSRDGRFQIDKEGYIVNSQGYRVLGEIDGIKTPIQINNSDINLNPDGTFVNGEDNIKFSITRFADTSTLAKESANCYISKDQSGEMDTESNIRQKALERSNVDMVESITEMISIARSYESNQKVIQSIDETLGKSVNEVGKL
jgi:flagellar basal-body rod protein FlgG